MGWIRLVSVLGYCFFLSSHCLATTLTLSGQPEHIEASTPFEVDVTFSGSKGSCGNKTYYLIGLFSKDNGTLFGFTASTSGTLINKAEPPLGIYMITTSEEGSWSGKLRVKANVEDKGFAGAGMYQFRVDRFTATGITKAESSNSVPIQLDYVPPPTPTPTATATPTPTPTASTPVPTPSPTLLASSTPKPTLKPSPSPTRSDLVGTMVAGSDSATVDYSEPMGTVAGAMATTSPSPYAPWLILSGSLLMIGGIIPFGWKMLRDTMD